MNLGSTASQKQMLLAAFPVNEGDAAAQEESGACFARHYEAVHVQAQCS